MRRMLVLATQNQKKRAELQELVGERLVVTSLEDVGLGDIEIVEDAATFEGNAEIKARTVLEALRAKADFDLWRLEAVLADDSGIVVDALGGAPGVRSARFAADHGAGEGDAANNALLLERLADIPGPARTARFVCHIAVAFPDGRVARAEGKVEGRIADREAGAGGFGYDPLFLPDLYPGRHMAELTPEEKHGISHRGEAVRAALAVLG